MLPTLSRGISSSPSLLQATAIARETQPALGGAALLESIKTSEAWKELGNQAKLFAIVSVHGQQFKVSPNDVITFNRLKVGGRH